MIRIYIFLFAVILSFALLAGGEALTAGTLPPTPTNATIPPATDTPTPTGTVPTPTATATPTGTQSPTATATAPPSPTGTATATATAQPMPQVFRRWLLPVLRQ
jgi:hypothetical protein